MTVNTSDKWIFSIFGCGLYIENKQMIVEWNLRFKLITAWRQQLFDLQMHRLNIILPIKRKQSAFESTSFLLLFDIVIRINMFICMTPANGTSNVQYCYEHSKTQQFKFQVHQYHSSFRSQIWKYMYINGHVFWWVFFVLFLRLRPSKNKKTQYFCVMFSNL